MNLLDHPLITVLCVMFTCISVLIVWAKAREAAYQRDRAAQALRESRRMYDYLRERAEESNRAFKPLPESERDDDEVWLEEEETDALWHRFNDYDELEGDR